MPGSIRLFRVFGIDVAIHPSWLLIFGLVSWSLATSYFPLALEELSAAEAWTLGIAAALLLFGSVLIHELAHSIVAIRRGLEARSITLFIFGGVSSLAGEAPRPSTEFVVAIVGPLTSFAIAALSFVVASVLALDPRLDAVAEYLAIVNSLLGAFNLIPGFPLDGGRVLRAIAWNVTGSIRRGTEIAVAAGRFVAYGFMVWGFARVFAGDFLGGIWIMAIGWFLESAASTSLSQVKVEPLLAGARVGEFVAPDTSAVGPDTTVAELIDDHLLPRNRRAMPVVDDGRLVGMVTIGDIRHVPPEQRAATRVGTVMGGREGVVTVRPQDSLKTALAALGHGDYEQVPVVDDGRVVGVLTRADLLRQVQLREVLDLERSGS